jgi:uncharacterized membrane protein
MVKNVEFYEAAAQILPVLLLAMIVQLRLFKRSEEETVGQNVWLVGDDREPPSGIADAVIILAIFYGLASLVYLPVRTRVQAIREAIPRWLAIFAEVVLSVALPALVLLATFGVIPAAVLPSVAAGLVLVLVIVGRALGLARQVRDGAA